MKNIILIMFVAVLFVGCKPRPWSMAKAPDGAPPIYKQGWNDGCESGLSVYGNDIYKAAYSYKQDVKLMTGSSMYFKAWIDSFNYCRGFVNRFLGDGFWGEGGFSAGNMRNRKGIETTGLSPFGKYEIKAPGMSSGIQEFSGIEGFNSNYSTPLGVNLDGVFSSSSGDWLGREDGVDWLGRPKEYQDGEGLF